MAVATATSASVVVAPMERRIVARASSGERPHASSTCRCALAAVIAAVAGCASEKATPPVAAVPSSATSCAADTARGSSFPSSSSSSSSSSEDAGMGAKPTLGCGTRNMGFQSGGPFTHTKMRSLSSLSTSSPP